MSCNGCRVLRKGCSEACLLRSCLHWITSPEAQGNATLFLAKFFGRSDLMSLISAVPESQRPALFQSLLFEACGRTVNPVNGAVGLLWSGNWQVCQAAVETVLSGGTLRPLTGILPGILSQNHDESSDSFSAEACTLRNLLWPQSRINQASDLSLSLKPKLGGSRVKRGRDHATSFYNEESSETTTFESNGGDDKKKLLNLFV
ncbi:LOB domain-containing protein 38-like [Mercurialis annua]|uniref:LOB domain-containing protein 38-like n=1 Tax=Mercurialis annua TaxID=3986 RepID=UPI00215DEFB0|nr:LOB domain-containing protein 38-like [Mercurialis annua]